MQKLLLVFIINIFFYSISNAQPGMWTWMHGSNLPNPTGSYGAQGVPSAANVPLETYEGCEWTDLNGNFWYYGGTFITGSGTVSALWKYNPAINMWTWVQGPNTFNTPAVYGTMGIPAATNSPGPRGFGASTWVDLQGNLWLFGGIGLANNTYSDLWKYNIAINMWTWMNGPNTPSPSNSYGVQGVSSPTNYPPNKRENNASWVDNAGNLWLFGGETGCGASNDLWKYDMVTNQWTWIRGSNTCNAPGTFGTIGVASPANDPPAAMHVYAKWKDGNGDFWFMGGSPSFAFSPNSWNQLWKYNVTSNQWTCVRQALTNGILSAACVYNTSNQPEGRYESRTCWVDNCGKFWFFGGTENFSSLLSLNDLWCYDPHTNEWTFVSGNAPASFGTQNVSAASNQPPVLGGAVPYHHTDGSLWFFGGMSSLGKYNSMWRYVIDTNCVGGCVSSQNPIASFTGTNLTGCSSLTVNFSNTSSNATSWSWNFGDGNTSTAQSPSHIYTSPGQYTVTLISTNSNGSDTITSINFVSVLASPIIVISPDVSITAGTSTPLNASGGGSYNWFPAAGLSCTNCPNPLATPSQTTTYCVEVTNTSGCIDTACSTITLKSACGSFKNLKMPNVFTPNNDGNNDIFYLEGWDLCAESFEMIIYNRWGIKIFESTNANVEWDGRMSGGVEAQEGTYYCIFNITNINGEQENFSTFITLIR